MTDDYRLRAEAGPLTATRRHYETQARDAQAMALVDALRRLQSAQKVVDNIDFADLTRPDNSYEVAHHAVLDERVEAFRIANQLGLDMRIIERAVQ